MAEALAPNRTPTPGTDLERGSSVGRYLLIGLLGKGGMGEVYAAYDPELDRKIALKLLRTSTSAGVDPSEGRARLLREAQAIARLSDPNVVVVFDVGTFGDRVFLAMEFVDGSTLGYWLQAQTPPPSWKQILAKFTLAGRGLACAHRAGVVHRDFKADNVMVGRDGGVRVMDFGLARSIEPAAAPPGSDLLLPPSTSELPAASATPTRRGVVPAFLAAAADDPDAATAAAAAAAAASSAAPAAGEPREPTGNLTRILSRVGVSASSSASSTSPARPSSPRATAAGTSALDSPLTLSGAMMGTPAYMAPEQFRGSKIDARADQFSFCVALYEALYGKRPFEGRSINELTRNVLAGRVRPAPASSRVPRWLRRVLLRGLRVEPDERHPSMEALLEALARDPARTRRRWASATAVVGVVAALGMGLVRAQRQQRTRCLGSDARLAGVWELPVGKALPPRQEAIRQAFMSTGKRYAADSFAVVKSALDRYVVGWTAMARESCEATNLRGEQSAEVLDLRTSCLDQHFSEVRALANLLATADGDLVAKSVEAVQSIRPVEQCADIAALRAVVRPPDDPAVRRTVAELRNRLADLKARVYAGRYRASLDDLRTFVNETRQTKYEPLIAEALSELGRVELELGEPRVAEKSYEEAVILAEGARHDEVVAEAEIFLIYGVGFWQGRYDEGERWARLAGAVLRRLGPGHEVLASWRANNLGTMYEKQGRYAEALEAGLEAMRIKERALGPESFDVAISEENVALASFGLGRLDEAIVRGEHAIALATKAIGPDHPALASYLFNMAEFRNARGDFAGGRSCGLRAVAILEREFSLDSPLLGYPLTAIGHADLGTAQPAAAIPVLERALRIRETRDPEPALLGETRFYLGRALVESGHAVDRGMALARQARADLQGAEPGNVRSAEVDRWLESHRSRASAPLSMR